MNSIVKNVKRKAVTISTGLGAASITIGSSLTGQASNLCTGACGSCGFGCGSLVSVAGLSVMMVIGGRKKLKIKKKHVE